MTVPRPVPRSNTFAEDNPYALERVRVLRVYHLTELEKLFLFRFEDPTIAENWTFKPGQFVQLTIPGIGEVPISVCSSPMRQGFFELCIRKAGKVTTAVHKLKPGDTVLVRGPYGNGFPVDKWEGMDLLLIAAGLGTAPLRSVFLYAMDNRWKYGNITFINTARYGKDLLFYKELEAMKDIAEAENVKIIQSVTRDPDWPGPKGRPQNFIVEANTNPKNTAVAICGPPRMYKDVFEALINYGYRPENIYVTLERMMKCGIGKCGHCNVGTSTSWKYVCKDGPVFTYFDIVSTPGMLD